MAEHTRAEREQNAVEQEQREDEALDEADALEQEREAAEARKARKGRMPLLFSSPAERLGFALAGAGVPLLSLLGPHVVNCVWRADGFFALELTRTVFIDSDDVTLRFDRFVEGKAAYDGLTELVGVQGQAGELRAAVSALRGSDDLHTLAIQFSGQASWLVVRRPPTEQSERFDWPELHARPAPDGG